MNLIWGSGEGIYFFAQDWTGGISLNSQENFLFIENPKCAFAGRPLQRARHVIAIRRGDRPRLSLMEVYHAQASRSRKPPQLSALRVSGGSHSPRKPMSNAGGVSSTSTSN
jgi:hypothetical protein